MTITRDGTATVSDRKDIGLIARAAALSYGGLGIALTIGFWAYFVTFLSNAPRLDRVWARPSVDVGAGLVDPYAAAAVNLGLISLFGLQHSLMARPWFKQWMSFAPAFERAHYVYASNAVLVLLLIFWQPIPEPLWHIEAQAIATAVWIIFALAWLLVFASAYAFGMADLLGLTQIRGWLDGRPPRPLALRTHWLYQRIRHPMYLGTLIGVWATPHMTVGHALLALGFTVYIAIGVRYEERDLVQVHRRPAPAR